mmetsp:Transcript_71228/g.201861  ORF Transcript_71228/g.201861 Transcript_71228/m.201861 type:complete len:288 (-) Transcript_71228:688-1551(-)
MSSVRTRFSTWLSCSVALSTDLDWKDARRASMPSNHSVADLSSARSSPCSPSARAHLFSRSSFSPCIAMTLLVRVPRSLSMAATRLWSSAAALCVAATRSLRPLLSASAEASTCSSSAFSPPAAVTLSVSLATSLEIVLFCLRRPRLSPSSAAILSSSAAASSSASSSSRAEAAPASSPSRSRPSSLAASALRSPSRSWSPAASRWPSRTLLVSLPTSPRIRLRCFRSLALPPSAALTSPSSSFVRSAMAASSCSMASMSSPTASILPRRKTFASSNATMRARRLPS